MQEPPILRRDTPSITPSWIVVAGLAIAFASLFLGWAIGTAATARHVNSDRVTPFPQSTTEQRLSDATAYLAIVSQAWDAVPHERAKRLPPTATVPRWMIECYVSRGEMTDDQLAYIEATNAKLLLDFADRLHPPACRPDTMPAFFIALEDWQRARYRRGKPWKSWYTAEEARQLGLE